MERSPLVLIHGFSGTPGIWEPVLPLLAEHHEVLAPVTAGHCGGAELAEGVECGVPALVDELESQLDAAGIETAHIAGNSLGGWLALELARRGRARSVVALAPAGGWEPGSAEEQRLRKFFLRQYLTLQRTHRMIDFLARRPGLRKLALRDISVRGDRYTARQARDIMRGSYECPIYLVLMEAILRDGPPEKFDGIDVPVRIAFGTRDRVLPHDRHAPKFRRVLPDAEHLELDGVGHCPMVDDPALVARAVLEVTSTVDAAWARSTASSNGTAVPASGAAASPGAAT
jgi:pimeloyl-ACP methyl ester carboxylesterase